MIGFGYLPITGGLFLGDEATDSLSSRADLGRISGIRYAPA
jgi:hypothetical protein